jgi:topoisomerase-4 subunit A
LLLGEFKGDDKIVVWTSKNQYYITGFSVDQHFPDETIRVEKFVAGRIYSLCYYDREQKYYYMKRFQLEASEKLQSFLDEDSLADFVCITGVEGAKLIVTYQGAHAARPADEVDVDSFIGVKSHRAKGKRITTYEVATLRFIEPEEPESEPEELMDEPLVEEDMAADDDVLDMDDIMGEEIKADPNVDYRERDEQEGGFTASQLDLF